MSETHNRWWIFIPFSKSPTRTCMSCYSVFSSAYSLTHLQTPAKVVCWRFYTRRSPMRCDRSVPRDSSSVRWATCGSSCVSTRVSSRSRIVGISVPSSPDAFSHLRIFLTPTEEPRLFDPFSLAQPSHAVVVDASVTPVREGELFHCRHRGGKLRRLYFCSYDGLEQRNYESDLRREMDAFARLVEERDHVIIASPTMERSSLQTTSRNRSEVSAVVIVDSREFAAELPSALYRRGFQLIPVTLAVCDYVLAPDVGVERKAFSDLVASLASGRLQKQMEQMTRLYPLSLLLVEMEAGERGLFKTSGEATVTTSRLMVLLRLYPRMRILWSFSDRSTCRVSEGRECDGRCSSW